MMRCDEARARLGRYVDGETTSEARAAIEAHLAKCAACRAELRALRTLAAELARPSPASVPTGLFDAVESRLHEETKAAPDGQAGPRFRIGPLQSAMAAAVVFAVGIGLIATTVSAPKAEAATVHFEVLLDALPLDARKAFRKFLLLYDARAIAPAAAARSAPELNFAIPEVLPVGFRLQQVYVLQFGEHPGLAASYDRDGEFLGVIFHRPVRDEQFGTHKDYECVVGKHRGHEVKVGPWRLVHLTDPTTCHCVLSRLSDTTGLPEVFAAVAPPLP